jgi:hypothetical protein
MNITGIVALLLSVAAFALTRHALRRPSPKVRLLSAILLTLPAIPSLLFAVYYLHIVPEVAWFYTLRSWTGSEFLVLFLGCAAGAIASLGPPRLAVVSLGALVLLGVVPYIKPLLGPLPDGLFQERRDGEVSLQSTPSTCGPAGVTTILRSLGAEGSEKETARAAFSYSGGTEAWYLARYVRTRGFVPRFEFRRTFSPDAGFPALVGVRLGRVGHFIAVLDIRGDQVTFADPLHGREQLSLSEFQRRYEFTGFHMVVSRA